MSGRVVRDPADRCGRGSSPEGELRSLAASGAGASVQRVLRAVAIIGAAIAICCAIDAARHLLRPSIASSALEAISDESAADVQGAGAQAAHAALPEGFGEEVLDVSQAHALKVAADGAVVGFTEQGRAQSVFADLGERLAANGWEAVDSGRGDCGTFVKDEGRFTWLFVSCTQVSYAVSVVIQSLPGNS